MPGKKLGRGQKRVIASGKLAGKKQRQIAKEAGCSVATVSHAGKDPEVASLLRAGVDASAGKLVAGYIKAIEELLKDLTGKGYADRAAARSEMIRLLLLADKARGVGMAESAGGSGETAGEFTLTELLTAYNQVKGGKLA